MSERLFHGNSILNLPGACWAVWYLLLFATMITGLHQITYTVSEDATKQIGFLWSVSWTVNPIFAIPIYTMIVYKFLSYWKFTGRHLLLPDLGSVSVLQGWDETIQDNRLLFNLAFLSSWLIVFLLQWLGIHLYNLLNNGASNILIDWYFAYLVRPDAIGRAEMIGVSFLGWVYMGMIFWFVLLGLVFTYIVSNEFSQMLGGAYGPRERGDRLKVDWHIVLRVGNVLVHKVFISTIVCMLIGTVMKLQAAYVVSFSENFTSWLLQDIRDFVALRFQVPASMPHTAVPYITSFALNFFAIFVFGYALSQIYSGLASALKQSSKALVVSSYRLIFVTGLVAVNYLTLGSFVGFSILLFATVLAIFYCILSYQDTFAATDENPGQ